MKAKKLELRKEIIASLSNDAMANVVGGELAYNTENTCVGSAVPYSQDFDKCPLTEFNTCDCVLPKTKVCIEKTNQTCAHSMTCPESYNCASKTITCP